MQLPKPGALLAAWLTIAGAMPVEAVAAQEFRIEDVTSAAALVVDQLKPKIIRFVDRPSEELIDPDAGLIRFEDWTQSKPVEKQFLSPYPSYLEPTVEITVDGVRRRFKEKLHVYVGEARFSLSRPPGSIDLASFVRFPSSSASTPRSSTPSSPRPSPSDPKDPRTVHNQHPLRRWCEIRPVTICIRSRYQFEGKLPIGIQIANKLRDAPKKIAGHLEFESELTAAAAVGGDGDGLRQADRARDAAGRRARAEHLLRQPGDAVRQIAGGLSAPSRATRARPS